jgi:putative ABC transport system substrate-binding protein
MPIGRRAFVAAVVGALLAAARLAHAQASRKVRRIGYLSTGSAAATYVKPLEAFKDELREHGWIEGSNVSIEYRWAEGKADRLPALAVELVRLDVDVIAASPTPAVLAAMKATTTIPIVGMGLTEPVAVGAVASIARPGGNVTGVTYSVDADIFGKQLQLLKDLVPNAATIAVLVNPGNTSALPQTIGSLQAAARSLGVELKIVETRSPDQFDASFARMARDRAEGLVVTGDSMFFLHRARLAQLAARHRLPAMSTQAQWVEAGGLVSYGPNLPDLWRRGATYVDKILRGAKPADLPVEQPTRFELIVNLNAAKAIGLTVPPRVLQRADQVVG